MTRIVLLPYRMASQGAKELQIKIRELGYDCLRVYPNRRYRPRESDLIVNWGYSKGVKWNEFNIDLNPVWAIENSINKFNAFMIMREHGVRVPDFTPEPEEACSWKKVYVRHKLNGHAGQGIEVVRGADIPNNAPLYVKAIDVKSEYRVHVFKGKVLDYQKKHGDSTVDIKNHANGCMFVRNVTPRDNVIAQAVMAVEALELDFGSVDVVIDQRNKAYVLEVNTASGIAGQTVDNYAEAIIGLVNK